MDVLTAEQKALIQDFLSIKPELDKELRRFEREAASIATGHRDLTLPRSIKIESRVKSRNSLEEKILRKSKENKYRQLENITDLMGIRVIVAIASDVEKYFEALRRRYGSQVVEVVDKRHAPNPREFGYKSLHAIVLSDIAGRPICCEVQIRTVLQHAWGELEHRYGYKAGYRRPTSDRQFSQIAALLEIADEKFETIALADKAASNIESNEMRSLLDSSVSERSLFEYVHSPWRKRVEDPKTTASEGFRSADSVIHELNSLDLIELTEFLEEHDFSTIGAIEDALRIFLDPVASFLSEMMISRNESRTIRELDLIWIALFSAVTQGSGPHGLKQLFDKFGFFEKSKRSELANSINGIVRN